jgi:CO/xanthine dehydrogenase Mo-binding subunit
VTVADRAPAALPPALAAAPRLAGWLRIGEDGTVLVRSGKVEIGQGVLTALAQIVAEELEVEPARVRMAPVTTGTSPDEGYTAGSLSVQNSGAALRVVAAEARLLLVEAAARRWGLDPAALDVRDGRIGAPDGRTTTYWEHADDALLDRPATGRAVPRRPADHRVVGRSVPRVDLPDKLTGVPRYAHDLRLDGMLHGRVLRPPARGAHLVELDTAPTTALPGVLAVVRDGDFVGVVAGREETALRALERLRADASWVGGATLPDEDDLPAFLAGQPADAEVLAEAGDPPAGAVRTARATYHRPFLAHASIGTSTATALVSPDGPVHVWSHTQGPYPLRREIAKALGIDAGLVVVQHVEGAGCYGHNGADDAAMDAVLLAAATPGRPVQVVWSRQDELGWGPLGPAAAVTIEADVGADGAVLAWRHEIRGWPHNARPGSTRTVGLLGASHRAGAEPIVAGPEPPLAVGGGAGRNAVPGYAFPAHRVVNHRLRETPLRTSAMRSLGALLNVFAAESFLDELAATVGRDPVEYRLAQLADPRARAVVEAAARRGGWARRPAGGDGRGHGIGYARYKNTGAYCAVVAEVEAVERVRVRRLTVVVDAGLVINPDGARNQAEGGAVQATSWVLEERVRFDRDRVTSDTWETYPVLRFSDVPAVEVELVPGAGNPALGVGEMAQGPTAAAIGNALCDAIGVRVRTLPLTPQNVAAAIPD